MVDLINKPPHYTNNRIEVIDFIQDSLNPVEFQGYCKGNVFKYLGRAEHKEDPEADYKKAMWYMNRLVQSMRDA
mgnify:FL=1|tara:strand:+ start:10458 stop:10679 length:222 start_codon:yes stop_codon:yes gene_type:complete